MIRTESHGIFGVIYEVIGINGSSYRCPSPEGGSVSLPDPAFPEPLFPEPDPGVFPSVEPSPEEPFPDPLLPEELPSELDEFELPEDPFPELVDPEALFVPLPSSEDPDELSVFPGWVLSDEVPASSLPEEEFVVS